jgi:hypothetical protein
MVAISPPRKTPGERYILGIKRSRLNTLLIYCFALAGAFLLFQQSAWAKDVTLAWDANKEKNLAGYIVYYKTGHSGDRIKQNYTNHVEVTLAQDENPDPNVVEFTVKNLADSENYVFAVTAFDSETPRNESDTSNEASTDTVPPPKMTGLTSSHPKYNDGDPCSKDHTVKMYWTEPVDPEPGSGLGGYSWVFDSLATTLPDENKDIGAGATSATDNLPDGVYWFHIRAGDKAGLAGVPNWGEAVHYGPICIDTAPPGVEWVYVISEDALEISYSETGMKNAAVAANYTIDNGVIVSGVTDVTGEGRIFRLTLSNLQSYIIYTMTISANVTDAAGNPLPSTRRTIMNINDSDSDGMADDWEIRWFGSRTAKNGTVDTDGDGMLDAREYNLARGNPQWGASRWNLSPLSKDSDGDGIPDKYEIDYGLNPVDPSDRNLDLDNDGWTNYEEYVAGYAANNANSPVPAPPQVKEVIPAGEGPVPSNCVFAVRLEATQGINIAESSAVTVTVDDGTKTYTRNLNDKNASSKEIVKAIRLDSAGTTSKNLWIVYYRSNETAMANEYPLGATVTVTFQVTDAKKDSMTPKTLSFRIQTAAEEQKEAGSLPNTVTLQNTPGPGLTTAEVTNTSTMLDGAAIIYDSGLPENTGIIPYFGPTEDIPVFNTAGNTGVGVAMNLLPPAVFPDGVTLMIPCPGYTNVSSLYVYYYNGQQWVMACDPRGNVQPGGVGWMVPGSRVNHNGNPGWIEIKVYHFSAVIAASSLSLSRSVALQSIEGEGGGGGGGGCFIDSLMR